MTDLGSNTVENIRSEISSTQWLSSRVLIISTCLECQLGVMVMIHPKS